MMKQTFGHDAACADRCLPPPRSRAFGSRIAAVLAAAWLAGCGGSDPVTTVAVEPTSVPVAVDCDDLDAYTRPLSFSLAEVVEQATGVRPFRTDPALSGAILELSGERLEPKRTEGLQRAGLVLNFGLGTTDPQAADAVGERLGKALEALRIPAAVRTYPVACAPYAGLDGMTRACHDAFVFMPRVAPQRVEQASALMRCGWLGKVLHEDPVSAATLVYTEPKGLAVGEDAGRLFAVRRMLAVAAPGAASPEASAQAAEVAPKAAKVSPSDATSASGATPKLSSGLPPVTADMLVWVDSTTSTTKNTGYELRVLAPGFTGATGSVGGWALVGLGARAAKGDLKCLRGVFRNVDDPSQRQVVDAGDCSSMERFVELPLGQFATSVSIKVSDNNVKGVGLASGTPVYQVDPIFPDFLVGVSSSNFVFDGASGTYAPDPSRLDDRWPYVIVGVEARASDSAVTGLTVHLGRVTAPEPQPDDLWQGRTVADLEAGLQNGLNAVYGALAQTLTFELKADCPSTLGSIEFCGLLSAKGSYSTSEMDSACAGTCNVYYESCKASKQVCEVGCCYGCPTGRWCSCNYNCGNERDACYNGCTQTFTGSAEVDVKRVTGLETGRFKDTSLPFITEGAVIGLETTFQVDGLRAPTFWRLCQSGICVSDTTPIQSSKVTVRGSASVEARACPSGPPALYANIALLEIVDAGVWNLDAFAQSVVGIVNSSMNWLVDNLVDLFYKDLQDDYEIVLNTVLQTVQTKLNEQLVDLPLVGCQN